MKLSKIEIKNFKSFEDISLDLNDFNVLQVNLILLKFLDLLKTYLTILKEQFQNMVEIII